ncbi:MAG: hypothetical protein KDI32_04655 [Pseudomonadales bacterium]|nr:hypothetical protein [Pseudomonadales bacterium]
MSEKPETDDFEDEETDEASDDGDEVDVDLAFKDLDMSKKRDTKLGDPAWRRLERLREERRTAELTSDFEDYDVGDGQARKYNPSASQR